MSYLKKIFAGFGVLKNSSVLFFLAFSIVSLINLNYSLLRNLRNVLVVNCTQVGAELIAPIQLWALLPCTFFMVFAISLFMRRFAQAKVFVIVTSLFLFYFALHAFVIFPHRVFLEKFFHFTSLAKYLPSLSVLLENWTAGVYYVAAELWKVAILSVLFFGFLNRRVSFEEAKGLYSPILLGGSLGGMIAGPVTVFCAKIHFGIFKAFAVDEWHCTVIMSTLVIVLVGALTIYLFTTLKRKTDRAIPAPIESSLKTKMSLFESLKTFLSSKYLMSLGIIVIADYVAYFLFEIFFLDLLKKQFPDPNACFHYNGQLTFWTSLLTLISATILTPILLKKKTWKAAALVTPSVIGLSIAFFATIIFQEKPFIVDFCHKFGITPLKLAILIGSVQFCTCRAIKNTLFDACKELAFIPLSEELQSKGKLIVDGLASRTGYWMGAGINQSLLSFFGTFQAGMPAAAIISMAAITLSINSVLTISKEVQKMPSLQIKELA